MPIVKLKRDLYINTDTVIQMKYERELDEGLDPKGPRVWWLYTADEAIKMKKDFNVNKFVKASRGK